MSTPQILYKYIRDKYAIRTLQGLELRVTPPLEFDDPFEYLVRVDGNLARERVEKMMKQKRHEKRLYEEAKEKGVFKGSRRAFNKEYRGKFGKHVNEAVATAEPLLRTVLKQFFPTEISQRYGILCLTEVRDSILMWSHYASGHRGIVVGIEIPSHWKLLQVDYRSDRVPIDMGVDPYNDNFLAKLIALTKVKSNHWTYEREWRAISELKILEKRVIETRTHYFAKIPSELIKEVIVGLRYPAEELEALQAAQQKSIPQAKLLKACLHDTEYELVIHDF